MQVQNGNRVLNRLVPCLKCRETCLMSTPSHFGPVLLPKVNKNDDEELCFLK